MPKIFCALFEGAPVRYIHLKTKKAERKTWFFSEGIMSAIHVVRDDDFPQPTGE